MPKSELAASATQKGPSIDTELFDEAQLLTEESPRGVEILDRKYKRRTDDFNHGTLLDA